jgi:DNA-binding transcriptional LysR family regulator
MLLRTLRGYHRRLLSAAMPMPRRYAPVSPTNKRELLFDDKLGLSRRGDPGHRLAGVLTPEVRQMRYFTAVAEHGSFTGAARQLHVTQQAVSQQVKALERLLGVTLLERSSRRVKVTPEGLVFLADCRRVLAGADRAARRVQAAARGEAGTLRLVYTLVSAFETVPVLLARLERDYPLLKVDAREIFGSDVSRLLRDGACDLALAPMTSYPDDIRQRTVRREVVRLAVGESHRFADREQIELANLRDETLELWPHEMAPGYYDAIIAACRTAGVEPRVDQHGAGSTVWSYIADGRGVGLVVSSLLEQLPHGIKLIDLAPPRPMLTVNAVWRQDQELPVLERFFESVKQLGEERHWMGA